MSEKIDYNRNPTGRGGFSDNPQNRSDGRWKPENSQSYCLNMFLKMTKAELYEWMDNNPPNDRTMAQILALSRVLKAKKELADYKEVIDRTEGKAPQTINVESGLFTQQGLEVEVIDDQNKTEQETNPSIEPPE